MKYVFWHKNPDTDSYCSAISYATFLQDQWEQVKAIALWEPNTETKFVFEKAAISFPEVIVSLEEWTEVILVDHNEAWQSIDGRDSLIIDTVIDHHKVADFVTSGPVKMRCEKVWCTSTILWEMFVEAWYQPSREIALLMLSAIISDTLLFKSPTTTARDRWAVEKLKDIAGIDDLEIYAMSMFNAKSDLGGMSAKEIVLMDYKVFDFSGNPMWIGVLETTNLEHALSRKDELLGAMEQVKKQEWLDQLLFCIIDILQETNTALILSEKEQQIVTRAFGVETDDGIAQLWSRVSRKKQIVPDIDNYFQSL